MLLLAQVLPRAVPQASVVWQVGRVLAEWVALLVLVPPRAVPHTSAVWLARVVV
ncbi:hypothetical protein [Streptomyces poonensis]|uniref:hypothetical protein n=1 Tax=Streptomyces poonensis TaxID=68255 RepID=UPI001E305891|nr:hypothetical protein [Streptomyces poonensis]